MAAVESASHIGSVVAEKYKLIRQLGEGGMGRVFLARHELTGRHVALKLVGACDDVTRERLLREARSMGRLSHPNVVGVLDVGEWDDAVFLVMEYMHGEDLRDYAHGRTLGVAEAIDLLLPACSGVAAAHQAGILHRDLKPENLFICTDSDHTAFDTKVLDFGVARALDAPGDGASLTDSGLVVGTPKYMAAEQMGENAKLDERTDVYALALILYEMLAGRLPYEAESVRGVMLEILKGEYVPLQALRPDVPSELASLVMTALSGEVGARPPSVAAFAEALQRWAGGKAFEPPRDVHVPSEAPDSWRPPPRRDPSPVLSATTRPDALASLRASTPPEDDEDIDTAGQRPPAGGAAAPGGRWLWLSGTVVLLALSAWWWGSRATTPVAGPQETAPQPPPGVPTATGATEPPPTAPVEPAAADPAAEPETPTGPLNDASGRPSRAAVERTEPTLALPPAAPVEATAPSGNEAVRRDRPKRARRPARTPAPERPRAPAPAPEAVKPAESELAETRPARLEPAAPRGGEVQPERPVTDNRDPWAND